VSAADNEQYARYLEPDADPVVPAAEPISDEELARLREAVERNVGLPPEARPCLSDEMVLSLLARLDAERDARIAAEAAEESALDLCDLYLKQLDAALARAVPEGVVTWEGERWRLEWAGHVEVGGSELAEVGQLTTMNDRGVTANAYWQRVYRLVPQPVPAAPEEET